jgi:Replicase family/Primase C terminal 1 (PriCT-1)
MIPRNAAAATVQLLTERAPAWPLCGATVQEAGSGHRRPRAEAARLTYWQPNPRGRLGVLVLDDDQDAAIAATVRGTIPAPTALVHNPVTGHSHALYALADPPGRGGRSSQAAMRYAEAIWDALTLALGADLGYTRHLSRAPLAAEHELEVISGRAYELRELARGLALPSRADMAAARLGHCGRNSTLFQALRAELPGWVQRHQTPAGLLTALQLAAERFQMLLHHAHADGRLPAGEVAATVRSVYRYGVAHRHASPSRAPQLPGALDRSQLHSTARPPAAPVEVQRTRQADAGAMTASRRREVTRARLRAGVETLQRQGVPVTAAALVAVTGLSRAVLYKHKDLWQLTP